MTTPFSAGPQALGYLYQARVALDFLLQCPDEATLKIEHLDDIELGGSNTSKLTLVQLKHHITREANLTDYSPDLWKSIRVWAHQASDRAFVLTDTRLCLITTATAKKGSIADALRADKTDVQGIVNRLLTVAGESTNLELASSFKAFRNLTPAQRTALVTSMTIVDQHDNIEACKQNIRQKLRPAVHVKQVDALLERIEGWWFQRVVTHLFNPETTPHLSAFELHEKIASIAELLREDNLPIDFLDKEPAGDYFEGSKSKLYVRQLNVLGVNGRVVSKAILDYYRAFEQRNRWVQDDLIAPDDLRKYEKRLQDEWERYVDSRQTDIEKCKTEDEYQALGREILNWAQFQAENLRIRPRVEEDYVRRGSFHILADKANPAVHWHPLFLQGLTSSFATATSEL